MTTAEIEAMIASDERHWWYRGRRRVLLGELSRLALPADAWILDAGCGSGRTLDELRPLGRVIGLDVSEEAVAATRERGHEAVHGAIERMPFADACFDLVTCLDVIEHTADDRRTFGELRRVTRCGGILVVTVPAYQALWSAHDVVNGHLRRYRATSLRRAAQEAGWTHVRDTHFNALLLGPAAIVRFGRRWRRRSATTRSERSELQLTPRWLDGALELPLRAEARLMRGGARLPLGLSLLAVFANLAQPAAVAGAEAWRPARRGRRNARVPPRARVAA